MEDKQNTNETELRIESVIDLMDSFCIALQFPTKLRDAAFEASTGLKNFMFEIEKIKKGEISE